MHNELRYPAKTHTISEKLSKERNKALHLLPNFFFFFVEKRDKEQKQQRHAYGKGNDIYSLACKVMPNSSSWREVYKYQDIKSSRPTCFNFHLQKISADVSQDNKRKYGDRIKRFLK
jgi:hypothetical protein